MPQQPDMNSGLNELRQARKESRSLFLSAGLFSFFVNLLMLTGPLFMLQVYDRVLGSRSEETLLALFLLVGFLFIVMGFLDFARGRIFSRIGARFQDRLEKRVFQAVLKATTTGQATSEAATALQDLEAIRRMYGSMALASLFDMPWTPVFLMAIFIFHPWLGMLAVGGGSVIIFITFLNQFLSKRPALDSARTSHRANLMAEQMRVDSEMVQSLGMREAVFNRWENLRAEALGNAIKASDQAGGATSAGRTFRLFLQSGMLALGAYLVLQGEITAGAMIAGSIMLGRALAPVEMAVNNWGLVQRAAKGWTALSDLLSQVAAEPQRTALPTPKAILEVQQATVLPPSESQASLRMVSFKLEPGQAMGVIGPSGAGKTTLARALTGIWPLAGGKIRLDAAALDQYPPDVLGQHIGYLPQRVQLLDGTIAENIARLSDQSDDSKIVAAAKKAAAHELILKLPQGYDTQVTAAGGRLSGGQVQRIGLARAMYGDPVILVLDEPNSNLDNDGSQALNLAIREMKSRGGAVLIMAHRPAAIQECDLLLVLENGMVKAFGPRDEVLRKTVQNFADITGNPRLGGVS